MRSAKLQYLRGQNQKDNEHEVFITSASHTMHFNFLRRLLSNCTFDEYVDGSDDVELSSDIEFVSDIICDF
jgi:hypothetical protein